MSNTSSRAQQSLLLALIIGGVVAMVILLTPRESVAASPAVEQWLVEAPAAVSVPLPTISPPTPPPSLHVEPVVIPDGVHSRDWSISKTMRFSNHTDLMVSVYWVNYDGKPVLYHDLGPGDSVLQQTYVSHPWIGKDEKGTVYPVVVADDSDPQAVDFGKAGVPVPSPSPTSTF
jgi:hypothetical protein